MSGWPWPLDGVQNWFEGLWDWITEAAQNAVSVVSGWITGAMQWLGDRISDLSTWLNTYVVTPLKAGFEGLSTALGGIYSALAGVAGGVVAGVEGGFSWLVNRITDGLTWLKDTVLGYVTGALQWATDTFRWLRDELTDAASWIVDTVKVSMAEFVKGGMDWVGAAMKGVADAMGGALKGFLEWIVGSLQWLSSSIMGAIGAVREAVAPTFQTILSGITETITAAFKPSTLPDEVQKASEELAKNMQETVLRILPKKGESLPPLADLQRSAVLTTVAFTGAYILGNVAGMAIDMVGLIKDLGAREAVTDILKDLSQNLVTSPSVIIPLETGVYRPLRYHYNAMSPFAFPGPGELAAMAASRIFPEDEYKQTMKFHALDETWSSRLLAAAYRVPGFSDLRTMLWRGSLTGDGLQEALEAQGVREDMVKAYAAMIPAIPGSGDLITMAVREVFTRPELQAEFPPEFAEHMTRQGYTELWAKYYWAAHWVLVPLGQLYEMYHRGIIKREVLAEQLKYHDYPAEWREKLMAISWRLPGAIEARWMVKWGEIEVDQLEKLLVADGLDPEWAPKAARAIAKNQFLAEMNRLRDNAKSDYAKGFILKEQLVANLTALGYSAAWIDFHIRDAVEDAERALKVAQVDALGDGYLKDLVNDAELEAGLGGILVRPEAVNMELERLYIYKYKKPKPVEPAKVLLAPVSTMLRAFRETLLMRDDLEAELLDRGYSPEDVELMINLEEAKMAVAG